MDVYHMGKPLELAEMVFGATGIGEAKVLTFELFMRVLDVTVKGNKEEKLKCKLRIISNIFLIKFCIIRERINFKCNRYFIIFY